MIMEGDANASVVLNDRLVFWQILDHHKERNPVPYSIVYYKAFLITIPG